jgi:hypothetical protein
MKLPIDTGLGSTIINKKINGSRLGLNETAYPYGFRFNYQQQENIRLAFSPYKNTPLRV